MLASIAGYGPKLNQYRSINVYFSLVTAERKIVISKSYKGAYADRSNCESSEENIVLESILLISLMSQRDAINHISQIKTEAISTEQ